MELFETIRRREGVTLFMATLAAFYALLYRYSGQDTVVVGTPVAGRVHLETEPLIGLFANTLAIPVCCGGNLSYRKLLARVRNGALGAYAHQNLPFDRLVEELRPTRDTSINPLFQVMFVFFEDQKVPEEIPGLKFETISLEEPTAKFDLTLSLYPHGEGLSGFFEYNRDIFDADTILRMIGHFASLAETLCSSPDDPLSSICLLSPTERLQAITQWNGGYDNNCALPCIHELFEKQAGCIPDAIAIALSDDHLTYRALNEHANGLASELIGKGLGTEMTAALWLTSSADVALGSLAILKAGAACALLDTDLRGHLTSEALESVDALITRRELSDPVQASRPAVVYLNGSLGDGHVVNFSAGVTRASPAFVVYQAESDGVHFGMTVSHGEVTDQWVGVPDGSSSGTHAPGNGSSFNFGLFAWDILASLAMGRSFIATSDGNGNREDESQVVVRERELAQMRLADGGRMYVLDTLLEPLPMKVAGRVYASGIDAGRGYVNEPLLTAQRLIPDPYAPFPGSRMFTTFWRGRVRRDATIEYLSRLEDEISGYRFERGPEVVGNPQQYLDTTSFLASDADYVAPRTQIERLIESAWRDMLHTDRVGLDDNFFDLGGHSFLLIEIQKQLQQKARIEIPLIAMFQHPTIRSLGRFISNETAESKPSHVQGRSRANKRAASRSQQKRRGTRAAGIGSNDKK